MSEYRGEDWFVIEGRIEHFQWAEGHENLLEQINHRARAKSAVAGAAAAALDMYGTLATSAMVAMYDGEYTENFACVIEGKVVCGTFCGARKLQNGDQVKVVVSPLENGVLYAHAVQRPKDELLWLPSQVFYGNEVARKDYKKSTINSNVSVWIAFMIMGLGFVYFDERVKLSHVLIFGALTAVFFPVLSWMTDYLLGRVGKEFGEIGSKIFTMLDFPDADNLDMQEAGMGFQSEEPQLNNIYMYRLALDAHANGTKIITRYDRNIARYKQEAEERKSMKKSKIK